MSIWITVWEISLAVAVLLATGVTVFILTLPSSFTHFHPHEVDETHFTKPDKEDPNRSGYAQYTKLKGSDGIFKVDASVQVVVLGDIGRSPRMQYHALSIANHGGKVDLIGYVDSEVHPDIRASRLINIVPIPPFPYQTSNSIFFLFLAPVKILWQFQALYHALGYRTKATKWMLVQNPPSIPTLVVAQIICFFRNTKLIIDWHNFGYSILALRLGPSHPLVKVAEWYEGWFARGATAHFAVTNAMCRVLKTKWGIEALPLHDRPAEHFQHLTVQQRTEVLYTLAETKEHATGIENHTWRLIVSPTSWTADEDFSLLVDALVSYSAGVEDGKTFLPSILAIITGKGPQKEHYRARIKQLNQEKKLNHVIITTAWLSTSDYARLLGAADLGISLHTSSSGVDLPMKVVDMFGAGLPVAGWSKFEAWPELVKEGHNGRGFGSADELSDVLKELFGGDGRQLGHLKQGALSEGGRRWDDEWMPVAGTLLRLKL